MSKYHAKETVVDGITFDSKAESEYYLHLLKRQEKGEISEFELQPSFTLQEGFKKQGKTYRPIKYVADFLVIYPNGEKEVIDVKGVVTETFAVKRKLFEKKFPFKLTLVKYVKKFGGWIEYDDWKKEKRKKSKDKVR